MDFEVTCRQDFLFLINSFWIVEQRNYNRSTKLQCSSPNSGKSRFLGFMLWTLCPYFLHSITENYSIQRQSTDIYK